MSRSYRKYPLVFYKIPSSFQEDLMSFEWSHARELERQCIHREMLSIDQGDVIFPGDHIPRASINRPCYYYQEFEIRNDYTTEVRNILNGYRDDRKDFETTFLECYTQIRNRGSGSLPICFEWLNTREAKKAVKTWKGNPLDLLFYLNHHRIIEKAVKIKLRRMVRK
jgi:hypothetical protein